MKNIKVIRTGGLLLSVVFGLSSCMMDNGMMGHHQDAPQPPMMKTVPNKDMHNTQAKAVVKRSTTEPAQKSAPGPKRAAAPQIPVM